MHDNSLTLVFFSKKGRFFVFSKQLILGNDAKTFTESTVYY